MAPTNTREFVVLNDGHKLEAMVDECCSALDTDDVKEVLLKVPLKHATRAVSLSEILQRRYENVAVTNELVNIFSGETGNERRKSAMFLIRIAKN
ncbi:hypothetical protein BgAZ_403910 [Babesia gibsoni]|uniref:Uncharacterized protein n=1 Tax=Babesia gibsoni TaxID=33632 RepID=A0AAD8LP77_BABGI|nr:hypothetical protein BgAZ_403910 [Babesia gibsoni]